MRGWGWAVAGVAAVVLAAGCAPALTARADGLPRAAYERELARGQGAAAASAWLAMGDAAARGAARTALPLDFAVDMPGDRPAAVAYRFALRAGDRLDARVVAPRRNERAVYLELFEVVRGAEERLLLIAHSDARGAELRSLVPRAGDYVLLVQPRLAGGGRYRIAIGTGGAAPILAAGAADIMALGFPVEGHTPRAIGSVFGDPRDGGARSHHGVDIFAPRGTPVLAAADGTVTNVANTPVGGRVVWQRVDGTGIELYYAHLDAQHVRQGQRVVAGQQIGTVGNTGNARGTPPHLHFGVYSPGRSPLDPAPLLAAGTIATDRPVALAPPPAAPRPVSAQAAPPAAPPPAAGNRAAVAAIPAGGIPGATVRPMSGPAQADDDTPAGFGPPPASMAGWQRAAGSGALHDAPGDGAAGIPLSPGTPVRVVAAAGGWYRVALAGGATGYVTAASVARWDGVAGERRPIAARTPLRTAAVADAAVIETIYGGEHVDVLTGYDRYQLVRTTTGQIGWIAAP